MTWGPGFMYYNCEKCGKKFTIPYPCLYNQMEDGVLVYLVPEESVHPKGQGYYQMADVFYSAYCGVLI